MSADLDEGLTVNLYDDLTDDHSPVAAPQVNFYPDVAEFVTGFLAEVYAHDWHEQDTSWRWCVSVAPLHGHWHPIVPPPRGLARRVGTCRRWSFTLVSVRHFAVPDIRRPRPQVVCAGDGCLFCICPTETTGIEVEPGERRLKVDVKPARRSL